MTIQSWNDENIDDLTETVKYHNETLITKSHFGYAIPQPQLLTADENWWLDCEG
jgi:hypothetical protein